MRFLLCVTALLFSLGASAQAVNAQAVIARGTPIAAALDTLAAHYGANVAYAAEAVAGRRTRAERRLTTLAADLGALLPAAGLRYDRVGRQYVVTAAPEAPVNPTGFVEDGQTGERLVGATVYAIRAARGASSNGYGYFALTDLSPGDLLVFRYLGYAADTLRAGGLLPGPRIVRLRPDLQLLTVEVTERVTPLERLPIGGVSLSPKLLERTRVLNGRPDINSFLAHRAGVTASANGYRGYGFRGADPEHNLTLLDDANLYLPSHAAGFYSVVPGAAVRSWKLYRDAGPARYGDRVGGVLDIRLREGNRRERVSRLDLGLSDLAATTEGPLGTGSYFVSGRRALSDFWLDVFRPAERTRLEARPDINFGFYDVAAKVNQRIGDRHQVYASLFVGRDRYRDAARAVEADADTLTAYVDRSRRVWQNVLGSVRHSVVLGDRWFANSTLTLSDFRYQAADDAELRVSPVTAPDSASVLTDTTLYDSRISDLGVKSDLQYALSPTFVATLGLDATLHRFEVSNLSQAAVGEPIGGLRTLPRAFTLDLSTYVSLDYRPSERLHATGGLRISSQLSKWSPLLAPLPRLRFDYRILRRVRTFGAVAVARQYVHRISTNNPGLPRDLWVPTIRGLLPLTSTQVSAGVVFEPTPASAVSVTAYRSRIGGLARLSNDFIGANYDDWIENLRQGTGRNYGVEVEAAYATDDWSVEATYTHARNSRRFEDAFSLLLDPERGRLDRRHAGSVLVNYRAGESWTLSAAARAGTGLPARRPRSTSPRGILATNLPLTNGWDYDGDVLELRGFFSLDLGAHWRGGPRGRRTWSLGAQNATLRRNPLFFNLRAVPDPEPGQGLFEFTEVFAPPVLPYVRFTQTL